MPPGCERLYLSRVLDSRFRGNDGGSRDGSVMIGLSWHCSHRVKSLGKALPFCLLAVAAAAFLFLGTARAQEEPEYGYVDLVMLYEQGPERREGDVRYTVKNNGTATAIGVTVLFLLEDLDVDDGHLGGAAIIDNEIVGTTGQRFTWVVGDIPPGGTSKSLTFGVKASTPVATLKLQVAIRVGSDSQAPLLPPLRLNRAHCWPITT